MAIATTYSSQSQENISFYVALDFIAYYLGPSPIDWLFQTMLQGWLRFCAILVGRVAAFADMREI